MGNGKNKTPNDKISREFSTWLDRLAPEQEVRAIVLLEIQGIKSKADTRQTRTTRGNIIKAVNQQSSAAMKEVNDTLQHYRGKLLSEKPDILGSVVVEGTPSMILALARSESVKAIMGDQSISLID